MSLQNHFKKEKPWALLGWTQKQWKTFKPWKEAGVTEEKFSEFVRYLDYETIQKIKDNAAAEVLVNNIFGLEA
jgi:hypothetical protein